VTEGQVNVKVHVEGAGQICAVSARRTENEPAELIDPFTVVWKVETQPSSPSCGEDERLVQAAPNDPLASVETVAVVCT
jgi:hypothetical protein